MNKIDNVVSVNWELLFNGNETWQKGNIVLSMNGTRTITINNTEILKLGVISMSARNMETGKVLTLGESKVLSLNLRLIQKNITIEIGQGKYQIYQIYQIYHL